MAERRADGPADLLIVGMVQKPHGIRGELFIRLETDRSDAVFRPGRRLFWGDDRGRPDGGEVVVERSRPFKNGVLVRSTQFTGLTPEVEALRGRTLLLPRAELEPLDSNEVFVHQLVGLGVRAGDQAVGVVREVFDAPGGPLLEVRRPDGRDLLLPFVAEMIVRVDVEGGTLEIDPPAGLLDL